MEQAARGSAGGRYELELRAGGLGRRRRHREEHESAAAATAVEEARWPRSGPRDPALLTAAAATRSRRGSRRHGPQHRPPARPPPLPQPSSLLLPPSSVVARGPGSAWFGVAADGAEAEHGAVGAPAAVAAAAAAAAAAGGSGCSSAPGVRGCRYGLAGEVAESGGCRGSWPGSEPRDSRRASPGPGRARDLSGGTKARRPRFRGWKTGRSGVFAAGSWGPHPQLSRVRGSFGRVGRKEWGCGLSGQWGVFGTGFSRLDVPSCLLSPPSPGDPILPSPHTKLPL